MYITKLNSATTVLLNRRLDPPVSTRAITLFTNLKGTLPPTTFGSDEERVMGRGPYPCPGPRPDGKRVSGHVPQVVPTPFHRS